VWTKSAAVILANERRARDALASINSRHQALD